MAATPTAPPASPPPGAGDASAARPGGGGGTAAPAFFAAAVLVLATAIYTQANLLFWLFGLAVGAAVFAAGHGSLALRGVSVTRLPPARCEAGGPLSIGYEVSNAGPLACFSLRIRELGPGGAADRLPWAWAAHAPAGGTARVSAQGRAPARGEHALGVLEVSTTFPLGLFRRRRVFDLPDVLRVLPGLTPLAPALVVRSARPRPGPGGASVRVRPGVEGDFYGSRGYRPGDPLRTLDWKRSARQGELMVRELATPEPPRVAILLLLGARRGVEEHSTDADREAADREAAISLAASLVVRGHAAGFRVGLAVAGAACPAFTPHHALAHRDRLLGALGRIDLAAEPGPAEPTARALREATVLVAPADEPGGGAVLRFTAPGSSRTPAEAA